ncbi:TPA: hypothetical protein MDE14_005068 [Klebsiella pneumoniae]|uniref:hypothetical protein n=1 Tax=Klebsiella pneumoniae TaxID=573 RepID=UPI0023B1AEDA|nr:hypothetical protein [Klebsiella pneumoniae]MDE8392925.1 hypothetical protein [Klebsiella pneumoniae]HBU8763982.1 hypothetical protein [Klebsiella pneumoniae]
MKFDQTITLEDFSDILADDGLIPEELERILSILAEISPHTATFHANTPELVQLAALYSPTFQALQAQKQQFCASVLTMPLFFMTSEEES